MLAFAFSLLLLCTPTALLDFAAPKWQNDKAVQTEDAYKYIYQATRGGEHAAPDRDSAKQWLDDEWTSLDLTLPNEDLWEPLCPGAEIGRLNLRPYKRRELKEDVILDAFIASSREYHTEPQAFIDAWNELGKRLKKGKIGDLTFKKWTKLDAAMKAKGYPAIHHSKIYENAHHPAYRVLTLSQAKLLMPL